jgi:hypothetical protein
MLVPLGHKKCFSTAGGLEHGVARELERLADKPADRVVVLDEEDRLGAGNEPS